MREDLALERLFSAALESSVSAEHSRRGAACPSVARLARGQWTAAEQMHVARCSHCRHLVRQAERRDSPLAVSGLAVALATLALVVWAGWRYEPWPRAPLERFDWSTVEAAPPNRPAAEALRSIGAPFPPELRWTDVRRDPVWQYLPASPDRPLAKPLERYTPPKASSPVVLRSALNAPDPPAIPWSPGPQADSIDRLFQTDLPSVQSL